MIKTLTLNDHDYLFRSSGALPIIYKQLCHGDLLRDLSKMDTKEEIPEGLMEVMTNLAYCMARHAKDDNTEDIITWSSQFEFEELAKVVLPFVSTMWAEENKTTSKPKKSSVQ